MERQALYYANRHRWTGGVEGILCVPELLFVNRSGDVDVGRRRKLVEHP